MQTLKFRAWDKHNERMLFSDNDKETAFYMGKKGMICAELVENDENQLVGFHTSEIEDAVIMQFVGHMDRNGVEAYEDDIVRIMRNNLLNDNDPYPVFELVNLKTLPPYPGDIMGELIDWEIIGNIHQNHKLIELHGIKIPKG